VTDSKTSDLILFDAKCPQCGCEYETPDASEPTDPNRLCPGCFEDFEGMTLEEIMR